MRIYVLPVRQNLQPESQSLRYPQHNQDYGVEQDFHEYLLRHKELRVQKPGDADWHYLPIYWNRYYVNHDYGRSGLEQLQKEVDRCIIDDRRAFTVCQNHRVLRVDFGRTIVFSASRIDAKGVDIPLLCAPHRLPIAYRVPLFRPRKKYLASFVGRLATHPIRQEVAERLINREDICIVDGNRGTKFFVKTMLESYVALCPRGDVPTSYRYFEAMQLGIVPFLIGDLDIRPFKRFIHWDDVSFFSNSVSDLSSRLDSLKKWHLLSMGERAGKLWRDDLAYQKWCEYVIRELGQM